MILFSLRNTLFKLCSKSVSSEVFPILFVPTLSDDISGPYEYRPLPCFLEAEFHFYDKKIERINLRQLAIVNEEIRLANEEAMVLRKVERPDRKPRQKK